jgi:hypothetical protein
VIRATQAPETGLTIDVRENQQDVVTVAHLGDQSAGY